VEDFRFRSKCEKEKSESVVGEDGKCGDAVFGLLTTGRLYIIIIIIIIIIIKMYLFK